MSKCNISELSLADELRNFKYDLKQNLLIIGSPLTLQYIALSRIAISMWHAKLQETNLNHLKGRFRLTKVKSYGKQVLGCFPRSLIPKRLKLDLEPVIFFIGEEISDYFRYQVKFYRSETPKKLKIYLNNLCWNQQGTINIVKTARKIIDQTNLNIEDKFILACNCCLQDKVRELREILPLSVIRHFEENLEPFSLPVFWSSYILNKKFPRLIKSFPALEYLLKFANTTFNKAAVQYFLDKFATETWKGRLAFISGRIFGYDPEARNCDNILLYFCMQLSQYQLKLISLDIHFRLLMKLHSIQKCYNFFPVLKYVNELIKDKDVIVSFQIITFCWHANILALKEDFNVFDTFVLRFKNEIANNIERICESYLFFSNNGKSMDVWEFLFSIATAEIKREFIYNHMAMNYCSWLICNKGIKYFDRFTNLALKPNEISQFEDKFFEIEGMKLCRMLVTNYINYDTVDKILAKFCVVENKNDSKKKLIYDKSNENILFFIIKYSIRKSMNLLLCINKFISWCLEGNKEEIARFKAIVFDLDSELYICVREMFFVATKKLIKQRKWKRVKKYWKWIFHATGKKIATPKEKLDRIKKILGLTYAEKCSSYYLNIKNYQELLKIFLTCFNKHEVEDLKEELWRNGDLLFIVTELLEVKKLSKANLFLNWCLSSDRKKINDFKTLFINSLDCCSLLFELINGDINAEMVKAVLTWLNPSVESVNMLKENFITHVALEKKLLFAVLDEDEMGNHWKLVNQNICKIIGLFTCFAEDERFLDMEHEETDNNNKKRLSEEETSLRCGKKLKIS